MFTSIYGNEVIKAYLQRAFEEERVPQTLLFEGMEGIGKSLFAKELAAGLLKSSLSQISSETHPDFHVRRPEGKSGLHSIDDLRSTIDQVYEAPFVSKKKVFLIHDAERMQAPSANALLKTLEEPPLDTTIILLTSQARDLLPTILSRCIQLHFNPLSTASIVDLLSAHGLSVDVAPLAHGSGALACLLATDSSLLEMQRMLLDLIASPIFYPDVMDRLEKIESLLETVKGEDPVAYHRRVDLLFATLLMGVRDQTLRSIGGALPFFPEAPIIQKTYSLSAFEQKVQEARIAFQRNMKLSICLQHCFCK